MNGIINTVVMGLSFITLYAINRARTGSAAATKGILKQLSLSHVFVIISVMVVSSVFAFILGIYISKISSNLMNKINYTKITLIVVIILILVNIFLTNWLGLIILVTASFLGIYTILSNSRRINLMGSLILPSIIFYLF